MIGRLPAGRKGTVLVVAMLLMTVLAIIGIAANTNVVTDTGIASNYLSSLQSFYAAEAGLEHGRSECVEQFTKGGWTDFSSVLRGPDGAGGTEDDGVLSFGGKVSFRGGEYSVRVVNDAGDEGGSEKDTNATITLISRGSYRNAVTTLSAAVAMNHIPDFAGAVNLIGCASTWFGNDGFLIDGRDYRLSDRDKPSGPSLPHAGISVSDVPSGSEAKERIVKSLTTDQMDNVPGSEPSPSVTVSATVSKRSLKALVDSLKRVADSKIINPADTLRTSGPDNSVTVGSQSLSLGTAGSPKLSYISKPSGGTITLSGSGFGVLVVEGDNLCFKPNIQFAGLIILMGRNIALDDSATPTGLDLYGGLVIAEMSDGSGGYDLVLTGPSRILFSREALNQAREYLAREKKYTVLWWQRSY